MADQKGLAEAIQVAADRSAAGANIDEVLQFMRTSGFSFAQCVIAVARSGLSEQGEAKRVVLHSPAWADFAQAHEQVVREIADEVP